MITQIYIDVPLSPSAYPPTVLDELKKQLTMPDLTPVGPKTTKNGTVQLPVGAQMIEMLSEDGYFFPLGQDTHDINTIRGITRYKSLNLNGDMTVSMYAYDSNVAHVRLTYA